MESLTIEQKLALKQFREDVLDILKPEHDDNFLLRWLRARQYDTAKAQAMLRKSMRWRKEIGAENLLKNYEVPEVIDKYVPTVLLGFDKEGSTVRLLPQGTLDFKGLVSSVRRYDLVKSLAFTYEYDLKEMKANNAKTGNPSETFVFIMDYSGFSLKQVASKIVMDMIFDLLKIFESNYPERLKTAYAINVPPLFSTLFTAVKPLLADETRKKFQFFGKDAWKEVLLKTIPAEILPVYLGGTRVDCMGDPRCTSLVPQGGNIPEYYYVRNQGFPKLSGFPDSNKSYIEARSDFPVEIHIPKRKSLIEWELESDGELGIGLLYLNKVIIPEKNEALYPVEDVYAVERLHCHLGSEVGTFYCEKSGFYILQFDNSFSKFKPKNIAYRYKIRLPESEEENTENIDTRNLPP